MPDAPVQVAMAWGRSAGGKAIRASDSVAGMTRAAPAPVMTRPASSIGMPVARAQIRQPAANTPRPHSSARLRPQRSPTTPAGISRQAKTMTYASTNHRSWVGEGFRSLSASFGTARLTAETIATTRITAAHMVVSTSPRLGWPVVSAEGGAAGVCMEGCLA